MHTYYDAIYLSPHLDDAALSCGGQIYTRTAAGQHVLIVSVMAGSPHPSAQSDYIDSLHTRWEVEGDAVAARRAEDVAACAILGADYLHLDVPDCIYRFHPVDGTPLYLSDDDIFGDIHPAETALLADLVGQFRTLPPAGAVYAPFTLGHHVDHLAVRAAAEQAWTAGLAYYEDYPYAQDVEKWAHVIADPAPWQFTQHPVDAAAMQAKYDAIWAFRSQLSTFFGSRADMERMVKDYSQDVGGERTWTTS